jgi:hypothetical protein
LEQELEARLRATIPLCRQLGYNPWKFEEILNTCGSRQTARRLVTSGELQYGLRRLSELGRLDLSMEQIMLEPQFAPLFTPQELEAARWHLGRVTQMA